MIAETKAILETANSHPFLFVGSGFTHRYLGTEDWKGLVSHFAKQAKPEVEYAFEWYRNEIKSSPDAKDYDLPNITELIEKDYARRFLADATFQDLRERYQDKIRSSVSPLKIGVSDLLSNLEGKFQQPTYPDEISSIGHARKNIAGIITTNFDRYLEHLFPEHVPYIGQNQLLFSQAYGVGEIYKIHGCVSDPASLVLTGKDYHAYRMRNAYLSAKLMTIFLEHPIIFLGYSLSDSNIRMIFNDIARCLNEEQLTRLSQRLIFVQRTKDGRPEGIRMNRDRFEHGAIESTCVTISDFSQLFKAIAALKTSYPPKILRKLKRDVYELVNSTSPKERLQVLDIDESTDLENVEFVMGVGLTSRLSGQGYAGVDVADLIKDLIYNESTLDPKQIVDVVLPRIGKSQSFNLPVFKYLSQVPDAVLHPSISRYINEVESSGIDKWITSSMRKARHGKSLLESISHLKTLHDCNTSKGMSQLLQDIAFVPLAQMDLNEFRLLLLYAWETYDPMHDKSDPMLTTCFRKAARIYDWLSYGQKKTPKMPKGQEPK